MPGQGLAGSSGVTSGAAAGTMIMPGIGTLIGAGIGAISDADKRKKRKKEEEAGRPKRRRLAEIQKALQAYRETNLAAQMTSAQAAFDFASNLRF